MKSRRHVVRFVSRKPSACISRRAGLETHAGFHHGVNQFCCQLLRGHTKLESTVRYLGIEVDDALTISEQVEL